MYNYCFIHCFCQTRINTGFIHQCIKLFGILGYNQAPFFSIFIIFISFQLSYHRYLYFSICSFCPYLLKVTFHGYGTPINSAFPLLSAAHLPVNSDLSNPQLIVKPIHPFLLITKIYFLSTLKDFIPSTVVYFKGEIPFI